MATAVAAFVTAGAQAAWIVHQSDFTSTNGSSSLCFEGQVTGGLAEVAVTTQGGNCQSKTVAGVTGVGTSGGPVPGEIGKNPEAMTFTFDRDVFLTSLEVSFLYPDGEFGDIGNEVAQFMLYDGAGDFLADFFLEATGFTTASFRTERFGIDDTGITVTNLSSAQDGSPGPAGGGHWQIGDPSDDLNIFGSLEFRSLVLRAAEPTQPGSAGADFSFVALTGDTNPVPVPEPGTLAITLAGLLGLAGTTRHRRIAAQRHGPAVAIDGGFPLPGGKPLGSGPTAAAPTGACHRPLPRRGRTLILGAGGWRRTDSSPTRSGPEGSSRNEFRSGSPSSLPPDSSRMPQRRPPRAVGDGCPSPPRIASSPASTGRPGSAI